MYVDVQSTLAEEYEAHCEHLSLLPQSGSFPRLNSTANVGTCELPLYHKLSSTQRKGKQDADTSGESWHSGPTKSSIDPLLGTTGQPPQAADKENIDAELYWCVSKSWRYVDDILATPIKVNEINDDTFLFDRLLQIYRNVSWRSRTIPFMEKL